jgi:hypothetical protein
VQVNTSQREQYEDIVYLFIGTGCSPDKITFMPLTTNHNHYTNYRGLCGLFLFKSVPPFVSSVSSCRSSFDGSFGIQPYVTHVCMSSCQRCFYLEDLRQRRRPPTHLYLYAEMMKACPSWPSSEDHYIREEIMLRRTKVFNHQQLCCLVLDL